MGDPVDGVGRTIAQVQDLDRRGQTACGSRYMPPTRKIMWMCYALGRWAINTGLLGRGRALRQEGADSWF